MGEIFLQFVNISITAGWVVAAVILLRLLLKKAPKWVACLLWVLVGVRLVFPFSVESAFSLIPSAQTFHTSTGVAAPYIETGFSAVDKPVNDYLGGSYAAGAVAPVDRFADTVTVLAAVWLLGIAVMLIYAFVSYAKLRHSLRTATPLQDNLRQSEAVPSPFILGMFNPKIYLPYRLDEKELGYIVAHEQAHLERKDHLIKPLAFAILAVYWFQPMVWVAYILLCRDIELACDEKVIRSMGKEERKEYSKTLLENSTNRRNVIACPVSFAEVGVGERIETVMTYRKPAFWAVAAAVLVCAAATVCFLTNPGAKAAGIPADSVRILYHHDEPPYAAYATVIGYNAENNVQWTYDVPKFQYLNTGIPVTEIGKWKNQYVFNQCGTIIALDMTTGEAIWKDESFGGYAAIGCVDEDGNTFVSGRCGGPDFYMLDANGKKLCRIESIDEERKWTVCIGNRKEKNTFVINLAEDRDWNNMRRYYINMKDGSYYPEDAGAE